MTTPTLPVITWPELLMSAPYFTAAMADVNESISTPLPEWALWPRALVYWDLFNAEVSNGGVTQYFYNQADRLPAFDDAPRFWAEHPVLQPHLHFVNEVHAAWQSVAESVRAARNSDEWPEDLFKQHAERFEALEKAFYAVNHRISCEMDQHIVANPHAYFDIAPLSDVPEKGLAWVDCRGSGYRAKLRFVDGFPIGPNVFERGKEGQCDVVWFTPDRQLVLADAAGWGGGTRNRDWLHYPSMASGSLRFKQGQLESNTSSRALWEKHGLHEYYDAQGRIKSSSLVSGHDELRQNHYHPNGQLSMGFEKQGHVTQRRCYWSNGQLNSHSIRQGDSRVDRYTGCWAEDGQELAPQGEGLLREVFNDGGRREGALVNGYLEGEVVWYDRDGEVRSKAVFLRGEESREKSKKG